MYNLKYVEYPSGLRRLVVYQYFIREDFEKDQKLLPLVDCPFEDEPVRLREIGDFLEVEERSLYESMRRTKTMIYDYGLSNCWDWFLTLTFSPDQVDRYSFTDCVSAMRIFLQRCRRKCPDLKYILVPELHKDGAFHFHGLFSNCDGLTFVDSGVRQKNQVVYNLQEYRYGFSTATQIRDTFKASNYISKYITKDLCAMSKGRKRYWVSKNLSLPAKQTMTVCVSGYELLLDDLHGLSRYYKKSVSEDGERISYFFEFDKDSPFDISDMTEYCFDGGGNFDDVGSS